ncbi:MAG: hypothetical protein E7576_15365 [Ruminococcaceae bacterium]|jgi:hypothetical protein|nr:hypothetical protein [Oscillospiraceae bacterium]
MKTRRIPAALLALLLLLPACSEQTDPEFAGCMTEAMCVANSADVIPSYYDVALKDKYNRDAESAEMLDIIRDSLIFDFGYLNSFALNTAGHLFVQLVRVGSTDFASSYAQNKKGYEKALEKMQEAYAD